MRSFGGGREFAICPRRSGCARSDRDSHGLRRGVDSESPRHGQAGVSRHSTFRHQWHHIGEGRARSPHGRTLAGQRQGLDTLPIASVAPSCRMEGSYSSARIVFEAAKNHGLAARQGQKISDRKRPAGSSNLFVLQVVLGRRTTTIGPKVPRARCWSEIRV